MGFGGTPWVARAWEVAGQSKDQGEEQQWHCHEQDGSRGPGCSLPRGNRRAIPRIPSQGQFLDRLHRHGIQFWCLGAFGLLGCIAQHEVERVRDSDRRRRAAYPWSGSMTNAGRSHGHGRPSLVCQFTFGGHGKLQSDDAPVIILPFRSRLWPLEVGITASTRDGGEASRYLFGERVPTAPGWLVIATLALVNPSIWEFGGSGLGHPCNNRATTKQFFCWLAQSWLAGPRYLLPTGTNQHATDFFWHSKPADPLPPRRTLFRLPGSAEREGGTVEGPRWSLTVNRYFIFASGLRAVRVSA